MKLLLALALLSGCCVYGMENNSEKNERDKLKKSQELPKDYSVFYDYPGAAPTYIYPRKDFNGTIETNPLSLSGRVPSQLIGAIITGLGYQANK